MKALVTTITSILILSVAHAATDTLPRVSEAVENRAFKALMSEDLATIKQMVEIEKHDPNFNVAGDAVLFSDKLDYQVFVEIRGYEKFDFNNKKRKILDYLVSKGARPSIVGTTGTTGLQGALGHPNEFYPYDDVRYVEWLLDNGSDIEIGYVSPSSGRKFPAWIKLLEDSKYISPATARLIVSKRPQVHLNCDLVRTWPTLSQIEGEEASYRHDGIIDYVAPTRIFWDYVKSRYGVPTPYEQPRTWKSICK